MKTWALRDDATLQAVQAVPFQKAMQAVDCVSVSWLLSASGIEAGLAAFHRLSYGLLQSRAFSNALSPCGCLFTSLLICSSLDLETGESLSFTLSTSYLFFN